MSKVLTSYKEKENAISLAKELRNNVRHLWVMIMQPRPSYQFYDVEIQHSSESPCSKEQILKCEEVLNAFVAPMTEDIDENSLNELKE